MDNSHYAGCNARIHRDIILGIGALVYFFVQFPIIGNARAETIDFNLASHPGSTPSAFVTQIGPQTNAKTSKSAESILSFGIYDNAINPDLRSDISPTSTVRAVEEPVDYEDPLSETIPLETGAPVAIGPVQIEGTRPPQAPSWKEIRDLEIIFQALNVIDTAQTTWCLENQLCHERNPIYGKNPNRRKLIATKLVGGALHYAVTRHLFSKHPGLVRDWQIISIALQGGAVMWNMQFCF